MTQHEADAAVKERPILFSAPMVRAILDGRKTQTRRVVKPQPREYESRGAFAGLVWGQKCGGGTDWLAKWCPYGAPGDRLWVRETWCSATDPCTSKPTGGFHYRADRTEVLSDDGDGSPIENADGSFRSPWRSPIHMPRRASRIDLEIVDVRVERLREITEEGALAEGFRAANAHGERCGARVWFSVGWDEMHGKRGDGFDRNPWVWVIEFKRADPTEHGATKDAR